MIDCDECVHKAICLTGMWVLASRTDNPDDEEPIILEGEIKVKKCDFFTGE